LEKLNGFRHPGYQELPDCSRIIAYVLNVDKQITSLHLCGTLNTADGLRMISESITALTVLVIWTNPLLTVQSAKILAQLLLTNKTLKQLNMSM
jgi:hypothetical protein